MIGNLSDTIIVASIKKSRIKVEVLENAGNCCEPPLGFSILSRSFPSGRTSVGGGGGRYCNGLSS